jgi:mannose-1-phosphate guanylyltransferase
MRILSLILAGGKGERFWPLSRKNRPKQLLDLFTG